MQIASNFVQNTNKSFLPFLFVFLILALADAVLSYTAPVFLSSKIDNTSLVGIVLASSSIVGFTFDIFAGAYLKTKTYKFFLVSTALIAILYPLSLLFSANLFFMYLLAMAFWGIYFELRAFSVFNYIKYSIPKKSYDYAWGFFEVAFAVAYLSGPIIASYLLQQNLNNPLKFSLIMFAIGLILSLVLFKNKKKIHQRLIEQFDRNSLKTEFRVWRILSGKIWIVWLMWFFIWCIDASIWTAGVLLSEKLKLVHFQAEFLIPIYILPKLFLGILLTKLNGKFEKKRLAFVSCILSGSIFVIMGYLNNINLILLSIFMASLLLTTAIISLAATFEDYVQRLGKHGAELIGLEQSANSLGYIVSPILTFFIINSYNEQMPFVFWGLILVTWGVFSFLFVPKIINMPQSKIKIIDLDV